MGINLISLLSSIIKNKSKNRKEKSFKFEICNISIIIALKKIVIYL